MHELVRQSCTKIFVAHPMPKLSAKHKDYVNFYKQNETPAFGTHFSGFTPIMSPPAGDSGIDDTGSPVAVGFGKSFVLADSAHTVTGSFWVCFTRLGGKPLPAPVASSPDCYPLTEVASQSAYAALPFLRGYSLAPGPELFTKRFPLGFSVRTPHT